MCPRCERPLNTVDREPQALRERAFITSLIEQCKSKEEVKAALVDEFGEDVLAVPDSEGFDAAAYIVPVAVPLRRSRHRVTALRWRRRRPAGAPAERSAAARTRRRPARARRRRRRAARPGPGAVPAVIDALPVAASGTTVFAAFGAGFLSFVSPCVLPLVPGYLSTISGVSFVEIQEGRKKTHILIPALIFCLSFSVMFILLGLTATGVGETLQDNRARSARYPGLIIIAMGVFFIGSLFLPALNREWRSEPCSSGPSTGGPVLAGLAFAVAWLPCTGATLGAVLTAAASSARRPRAPCCSPSTRWAWRCRSCCPRSRSRA